MGDKKSLVTKAKNIAKKVWYAKNDVVYKMRYHEVKKDKPEYLSNMEDGFLRVRITNQCNGKCRYCGLLSWPEEERRQSMDPKWLYEYMVPLYEKVKMVLITGGDALVAKESYNYFKFLSENYPQITIEMESNGIAFDDKYQRLFADNLVNSHFSINASNEEFFVKSCWDGQGGEYAYNKLTGNIENYLQLLEKENKICFAPHVSMVINKDNHEDVVPFLEYCLDKRFRGINYYFDYTESNMTADYFSDDGKNRETLRTLLEIERLLKNKVFINFRLWIPLKEIETVEKEGYEKNIDKLVEKYPRIYELSKDRSIHDECKSRNELRRKQGKKTYSIEEEFSISMRLEEVNGKNVCFAPWKEIDIYPNGRLDFCGWFHKTLNLNDFIRNEKVDWNEILNHPKFKLGRKDVLEGKFWGCMECCPMNAKHKAVEQICEHALDEYQ